MQIIIRKTKTEINFKQQMIVIFKRNMQRKKPFDNINYNLQKEELNSSKLTENFEKLIPKNANTPVKSPIKVEKMSDIFSNQKGMRLKNFNGDLLANSDPNVIARNIRKASKQKNKGPEPVEEVAKVEEILSNTKPVDELASIEEILQQMENEIPSNVRPDIREKIMLSLENIVEKEKIVNNEEIPELATQILKEENIVETVEIIPDKIVNNEVISDINIQIVKKEKQLESLANELLMVSEKIVNNEEIPELAIQILKEERIKELPQVASEIKALADSYKVLWKKPEELLAYEDIYSYFNPSKFIFDLVSSITTVIKIPIYYIKEKRAEIDALGRLADGYTKIYEKIELEVAELKEKALNLQAINDKAKDFYQEKKDRATEIRIIVDKALEEKVIIENEELDKMENELADLKLIGKVANPELEEADKHITELLEKAIAGVERTDIILRDGPKIRLDPAVELMIQVEDKVSEIKEEISINYNKTLDVVRDNVNLVGNATKDKINEGGNNIITKGEEVTKTGSNLFVKFVDKVEEIVLTPIRVAHVQADRIGIMWSILNKFYMLGDFFWYLKANPIIFFLLVIPTLAFAGSIMHIVTWWPYYILKNVPWGVKILYNISNLLVSTISSIIWNYPKASMITGAVGGLISNVFKLYTQVNIVRMVKATVKKHAFSFTKYIVAKGIYYGKQYGKKFYDKFFKTFFDKYSTKE